MLARKTEVSILIAATVLLALVGCQSATDRLGNATLSAKADALYAAEMARQADIQAKRAENALGTIREQAKGQKVELAQAATAIDDGRLPEAKSGVAGVAQRAETIDTLAATGQDATAKARQAITDAATKSDSAAEASGRAEAELPNVVNRRGFLAELWSMIQVSGWTLLIVGVLALLVYLGAGQFIRPLFAMLGLIPRAVKEQAERFAKDLAAGNTLTANQSRALEHRRATEPAFDAAFRRAFAKAEKAATTARRVLVAEPA